MTAELIFCTLLSLLIGLSIWARLTMTCPECNGKMKSDFYDMQFDKEVWKCSECKKEWI